MPDGDREYAEDGAVASYFAMLCLLTAFGTLIASAQGRWIWCHPHTVLLSDKSSAEAVISSHQTSRSIDDKEEPTATFVSGASKLL